MTRSLRLDREPLRKHLQQALQEITDGTFVKEWAAEQAAGHENFERLRALGAAHNPFTPVEHRIRALLRQAHGRAQG
jgi:ketol-acid reductoisomerase